MDDAGSDAGTGSLLVLIDSSGSGVVTSNPPGIDCGSACFGHYPLGTQVTVTGTPDSRSAFGGFIGPGCSGLGDCTVTITGDVGVIAQFVELVDSGAVDASGADAGVRTDASVDASTNVETSTIAASGGCSQSPLEPQGLCLLVALVGLSRFRGRAGRSGRRRC